MFCRQASGCFEKFENGDLHPQVSGVFRYQKRRFSESVSRVGFLKTEVFEYDDFIDHAVHGTLACVASVSNRVIARKLERQRGNACFAG